MIPSLDTCDWREAFAYAGEPGQSNPADLRPAVPGSTISLDPFTREDVAAIIAQQEGGNDGPPWRMVGQLTDGRWFYLEAGCDYTGWDCRSSGCVSLAASRAEVIEFGCTDEARKVLGLEDES